MQGTLHGQGKGHKAFAMVKIQLQKPKKFLKKLNLLGEIFLDLHLVFTFCIFLQYFKSSSQLKLNKSEQEIVYMKTDKAYERTYGWSWFLKLHQELKALGDIDQV